MELNRDAIPAEMRDLPQWVCWRAEQRDGKTTKVPHHASDGGKASSTDRASWSTFEAAVAAADRFDGIGFVTTKQCEIILLDLDHCIEDGEIMPWARDILAVVKSCTEVSPSGDGLHCYFHGKLPDRGRKCGDAEIYDAGRYFTVTGKADADYLAPFRRLTDAETARVYEMVVARDVKPATPAAVDAQAAATPSAPVSVVNEQRHPRLVKVAASLSRNGASPAAIKAALTAENATFNAPKSQDEIDRIIAWAVQHLPGDATPQEPIEAWPQEVLSIRDMVETEPAPYEWIVPELLTKGVCGVCFGEGGAAKSLSALWLGVRLATARVWPGSWLGRFPITEPRRVLYVGLEDLREDVHHRLYAIVKACLNPKDFTLPNGDAFRGELFNNLMVLGRETVFADNPDTFLDGDARPTAKYERLLKTCEQIKPDLVLLDTWSKASRADENENAIQSADVAQWTYLRDKTRAAVLLFAHANKAGRREDIGQSALRGASSRSDDLRFVLWLRPHGHTSAGEQLIEIANVKNTRTRLVQKFTVSLRYPEFEVVDEVAGQQDMHDRVLDWVKANPGHTQRDAIKALGGNVAAINKAFRFLANDGGIERQKDGYHAL
jgi:RecA-family ATPase